MVFASSEDDSLVVTSADANVVEGTSLSNPSAPLFMDKVPQDKLDNGDSSLPKTAPTPWAKVVSNPSPYNPQLNFMQPVLSGDSNMLCIPPELLEIGRKKYSLCLIGQFMGSAPKLGFIHAISIKLWVRDGAISISHYKDGLFLFQFSNESAYSRALTRVP
ncbi:hypothetical protein Tsubulata_021846 [Turnera subulata]|uniref:DUF4283 domain-containing protein n=1 Tax=Turnera subulata TaxID=218843 RepID=A0A9Q0FWA6_9ROSI|nr:hypothetical protein Tsubulata_021846 [Turnera subulata]